MTSIINNIIKHLSLLELTMIISYSNKVKSNYDICCIIYKFYKIPYPKFKLNDYCIKTYPSKSIIEKFNNEKLVMINSISYCYKKNTYLYGCDYKDTVLAEGNCFEYQLKNVDNHQKILIENELFYLVIFILLVSSFT